MPRQRLWVGFVLLAMVVVVCFVLRAPLFRALVAATIDVVSGYRVAFDDFHADADRIDARGVRVWSGGVALLAIPHVYVRYRLRDVLGGGTRRYGLISVDVRAPLVTLQRDRGGRFNVALQPPASGGPQSGPPLLATIRVTGGTLIVNDPYRNIATSRMLRMSDVALVAHLDSARVSTYRATGRIPDDPDARIGVDGRIDASGYALHHATANDMRIAPIVNYFINSPGAAVYGGTAYAGDVQAYTFGKNMHISGTVRVSDASMNVPGIAPDATAMNGVIAFYDNGIATPRMTARIGALDAVVCGGLYAFDAKVPQFHLGIEVARAPLAAVRDLFNFSRLLPLYGDTRVATLLEGPATFPVAATRITAPLAYYGAFPLRDLDGRAIYYKNAVGVVDTHARYAGLEVRADGNITTGAVAHSELVAAIDGPTTGVPYASQIAPRADLHVVTRIAGDSLLLDAAGEMYAAAPAGERDGATISGYFHVDPRGEGTFGPLLAARPDGSSIAGTMYVDRERSASGFWLDARAYRFTGLASSPQLPGLALTAPNFDSPVDGTLAGFGPPSDFRVAGHVHARELRVAGRDLGEVSGDVTGHLNDLRLGRVDVRGTWGRFAGAGGYVGSRLALRGDYDGSFAELRAFTGDLGASGHVAGPVAFVIDPTATIVQVRGDDVRGARVRGVPLDSLAGTLAVESKRLRLYAASAAVASGTLVAAGSLGTGRVHGAQDGDIGVSLAHADAARLHALAPLDSGGDVATIGRFANDGTRTRYDGGVALDGAHFQRIPISANGDFGLRDTRLDFSSTTAIAGAAVGILSGSLRALDTKHPNYDVAVDLAETPLAPLVRAIQPARRDIAGTIDGTFRVAGTTDLLDVHGRFAIPEGTIDGLAYRDASAYVSIAPGGVGARDGTVTVGSTTVGFGGFFRAGDGGFRIDAPRADLSDFNDLFDTGDTLGGRGHVSGRFVKRAGVLRTGADIAIDSLKYRTFSLGDALAHWSSRGASVTGNLAFGGPSGRLETAGTLGLAQHVPLEELLARSRFSGDATLRGLDLGVWLPALGYQLPVTGRVDADATIAGPLRNPDVRTRATLVGGTIGKLPVDRFAIVASSTLSRTTLQSADLELPSLSVTGSGTFGFGPRDPIALRVHAKSPDVGALSAHLFGTKLPVTGNAEADVRIAGTRSIPHVDGGFDLERAGLRGIAIPSAIGEFTVRGRDLVLSDVEVGFTTGTLYVAGSVPLQVSPFAFGPASAPVELDLEARNIDVADFAPLFPAGSTLKGILAGRVGVAGTAGLPRLDGAISLSNGAATTPLETVPLTQVRGTLAFNGTQVTLRDLHASAGGGTLDAEGSATLADLVRVGADSNYRFAARAKALRLDVPTFGSGELDGNVAITHVRGSSRSLTGDVTLNDAVIPFAALLVADGSGTGAFNATPQLPAPVRASDVAFDLDVHAVRNVRVRSANVDIGGRGDLHVGGTQSAPALDGGFTSTGGTLTYFNTVFRIIDGRVTFAPDAGVIPNLDAHAITHVIDPDPNTIRNVAGTADITLTIHGPVTGLNIGLSSDPAYDRQQILGLLLNAPALGASNLFGDTPGQATLYGSNLPTTLPRDVAASRNNLGELTVAQEAFGVANAQFTRTLLAPIETSFAQAVGLTNFNVNVDITGNVGFQARKVLGKQVSAIYGTSFGYPYRQTVGFEIKPNDVTAAQVTVFQTFGATGLTSLTPAQILPYGANPRITSAQPASGSVGFSLSLQRLFK